MPEQSGFIVLRGDGNTFYGGKKTFDDVNITRNGDGAVITWGTDSSVTLRDCDASVLTLDDFDPVG